MCSTIYYVYYAKPYPNDYGYLIGKKLFRSWEKAYDFMQKETEKTGFHCTYVELHLNSSGIFNVT